MKKETNDMEFLRILIIIFAIFGVSFLLMNIRYIFKGEEFRGTCASNSPFLKNKLGDCNVCGKKAEEDCKMPEIKDAKA